MATKNVNIDIIAKDKTRQAMQSATKGVDGLKSAVFNLRNALIGLGAGVAIKSFVDVGKQVESLQIRLKFLFGSVEEGAKAFDVMAKFASKVPFSLEQIQAGAGNLAVVSKNAEELQEILQITGRVASVTGLDFRTTAEQIQRSFSAGVASADIFRERGVRDLLGFKAGATVTAEETAEAFRRVFGANGRFANATSDLANTLEGTLSMIGDKFFNFQKVVAQSFFIGLKQEFGALDKALQDNSKTIDNIAKAIGQGLSKAVIATGEAIRFLSDNFEIIKAIGMAVIVGKIATAFLTLATNIKIAQVALLNFSKISKTTIVGALVGLTTSVLMLKDAFAETKEPNKELNKLLEKKDLILKSLEKTTGDTKKVFEKELELVNKQIEVFNQKSTALAMVDAGKQRAIITSKEHQDNLAKELQRIKDLKKEQQKLADAEFQIRGVDIEAISGGINFDDKLNQIREQFDTEFELQKQLEQKNINFIQDQAELEVEIARISATKKLEIAKKTADEQLEIQKKLMKDNFEAIKTGNAHQIQLEKMTASQQKDLAIKTGRELVSQLAQSNKTAFQVDKALKIAQAIMNTATGVTKALSVGNIPLAFFIGALGAVQVATIAKTKFQGFAQGGRPPVGQPSIVGEKGAELFVPDQAGTIVPNDKLGMGKNVTVNFNINTVDARGFNELLVNSRGTIVNLINSAMNEKGKMAIV